MAGLGITGTFVPSSQRPSLFVPTGLRASATAAAQASGYDVPPRAAVSDLARAGLSHTSLDSDVVTSSFMAPIFHLTSDDSTILAMEHNNHVKLLAISSSRLELLVTNTILMPVIENQGVEASSDDPFATQQAPPLDVRLLNWDPAENSVLVDRLRAPCTQLLWAPWQHGTYLGALSAGCFLHIYRYSHGRWALDASIPAADCIAFAFSCHFTIACACVGGTVRLYARHSAVLGRSGGPSAPLSGTAGQASVLGVDGGAPGGSGSESGLWQLTAQVCTGAVPADDRHAHRGARHSSADEDEEDEDAAGSLMGSQPDCVSVSFNEHGQLLVAGYADGAVRVFSTTHESRRLGAQVFLHEPDRGVSSPFVDPCQQVAWAPSAGRSFLMLALVFPHCVSLVLFRRPLLTTSAGPDGGGGGGGGAHKTGGSAGGEAHTSMAAGAGSGGGSGGAGGASSRPLTVIATSTVACEEVAKLSWNTTGTRFVTSHTDSLVQAWLVEVAYKQEQRDSEGEPLSRDAAKLYLAVSMRKISTVHPYHATGTR